MHLHRSLVKTFHSSGENFPVYSNDPGQLDNHLEYNSDFSDYELEIDIANLKVNSPGFDDVHNDFIKQLPKTYVEALLHLINLIWTTADVPKEWKKALITVIPKNDKPLDNINSYRPISLLPCLGKVMERMVSTRMYWVAEQG